MRRLMLVYKLDGRKKLEVFNSILNDLEELVFVDLVSPFSLPEPVDSFDSICQSLVGLLVYVHFLDVKVFATTFEGGYLDFEGLSRRPRRGRTGIGRGS